jgi:hypothetical protein
MNLGKWRQLAERARKMDRAELRFRVRQEIDKRQDGLLSFLAYDFSRNARRSSAAQRGKFFFGPESANACVELLRQRLPERAERIVHQANQIVQHRFDLLGYRDLDYGNPIDWHLDLVHGKRAPKKVFYRQPYLDFQQVGDSKVTWELNRHQHFVMLAKAHRLTGDVRFVDEILRQWRHWWDQNPYPVGINWASSLEAGFRSLSWLWTYHLLAGAPGFPDFRDEWLRGFALHGRHIERYLSTYFSPNTHLLGEGVALFFLGTLCPELAGAERWKSIGWNVVLEEARRQVRPDGFHFEQSTYYHVYALDFFLHAAVLASVNDVAILPELEQTLERMLTALCLLGRAGVPPRFGDDDGGRLFDSGRNSSEHLLDPLSTGAILFHRGDYKAAVGQLQEETIWLLGPEGVKVWDALDAIPPEMNSAALSSAGFYLLVAEKPATQLVVDCGPLGTQSGGHGHADALSVTLQSDGQNLLIDPGTYAYVGEGDERDLFRGTAMHNTLRVDGLDQAEPATAFSWRHLNQSKAESRVQGRDFDLLQASHNGYERLAQPVTHRRWVFSLRNGIYLVRDRVEGRGTHRFEISWHLAPELQLVEDGVFRVKGASQGLALIPAEGHGWAVEVSKQSCSPVYGQKSPMTVLTFSTTAAEVPRTFCCAIVTLQEALGSPGRLTRIGESQADENVDAYQYIGATEEYSFFFREDGKTWRSNGISSDAEFFSRSRSPEARSPEERMERFILVNGSNAEIDNGPLMHFKRDVVWGQLNLQEGEKQIFSSDPEAVDDVALSAQLDSAPKPSL